MTARIFPSCRLLVLGAGLALLGPATCPAADTREGLDFFEAKIRPVLAEKCYKCHAADSAKLKGGLQVDTRDGLLVGGDSGPAIVPGNLKESLMVSALRWTDKDMRMPPEKNGGKLPDSVIADFEKWIAMGAPDPREGEVAAARKPMDLSHAREAWAFQAPKSRPAPVVADAAWPRSEVDRFVLAAQEARHLHPVVDADKGVLIRRVFFDLIGLPPSPGQVDAFLKDTAPGAFERVVDALLGSPQFGERWGRYWLDLARYAESTGKERNFTYPSAWRYRDYVIGSINADKPYDEFIREQIAGDLLPARDAAHRNELLVATGFLALGPKSLNEKNREQFRMDLIDEQIDVTTRAVTGLTVACARCHDHKFDPVSQREYYALAGIFRSTETLFGTEASKQNKNASRLLSLTGQGAAAAPVAARAGQNRQRVEALLGGKPKRLARFAALSPAQKAQMLERLEKREAAAVPPPPAPAGAAQAMGVQDGTAADCRLLVRGEISQPAEKVPRGFVSVLGDGGASGITFRGSGRLELAQWLTASSNPLTARVMVNRVWQHLFGQGIVATPDNFGVTGEKPTHPELLDALAVQLMAQKWSLKALVRSLVLSRTYQLSSAPDARAMETDPDNRLLWRASPRRLDAEAIRDAMLAASGRLQLHAPGGSVVANVGDGYIGKGIRPSIFSEVNANCRSVYLPIVRDFVPEGLDLFDFAEPSLMVAARDTTNVPSQALFLMNNSFVREQSAAMAARLLGTPATAGQRVTLAYRLALGRAPGPAETSRAFEYLRAEAEGLVSQKTGTPEAAATLSWATFCQALFACAEFRYLK